MGGGCYSFAEASAGPRWGRKVAGLPIRLPDFLFFLVAQILQMAQIHDISAGEEENMVIVRDAQYTNEQFDLADMNQDG